jgi:hypothetical protein
MRRSIYLLSLVIAFVLMATSTGADWRADIITEKIAITATAATSDQSSGEIVKPRSASAVAAWLEVTAGSTLLLDVNLQTYSPTEAAFANYLVNCPSNGGVTGVSSTVCVFGPHNVSNDYLVSDKSGFVPTRFQFLVEHGNANAATYVLYYQWMF